VQSYGYDDLYELTSVQGTYTRSPYDFDQDHKTDQYQQSFSYDTIGNMLTQTSTHPHLSPASYSPDEMSFNLTYQYTSQKPHAATQIGNWAYSYDANGNVTAIDWRGSHDRQGKGDDGDGWFMGGEHHFGLGNTTSSSTQNNQGNDQQRGVREYGGDHGNDWGMGNSTFGQGALPNEQNFLWDEENRLIHSWTNGNETDYLYDYNGERALKRGIHGETWYVDKYYQLQNAHQAEKQIFVGDTRGVTRLGEDNAYDHDYEGANVYYYHPDHLGSTTFVTRSDGHEWEHMEYTPYGQQWVDEGPDRTAIVYRFTSKEYDTETGLYYFGARYMDPVTARWMSADPAMGKYLPEMPTSDDVRKRNGDLPGEGGIFNLFNLATFDYGSNNPLKYADPDGREQNLAQKLMTNLISVATEVSPDIKSAIMNHMSIVIDRNPAKGAFNSEASVMLLGIVKLDTVKVQSTADIREPRLSNEYGGRTIPEGTYTGALTKSTGSYLNAIVLNSREAGVGHNEYFEIHPNEITNPESTATKRGPFTKLGGISAGCQVVEGVESFNELTGILKGGGYKFDDTQWIKVEIKE